MPYPLDDPRMKHLVVLMMENRSFDHMLFTGAGVHPVLGTIAPLNGLAAGATLGHDHASSSRPIRMSTSVEGRVSLNGSWKTGGVMDIVGSAPRRTNSHILATVAVSHRDVKKVAYFSGGNDSASSDAVLFGLRETRGGATIQVPAPANFAVVGSAHVLVAHPSFDSGNDPSTSYFVYGGGLRWTYPSEERLSGYATNVVASAQQYEEVAGHPASFLRSEIGWAQQYTPDTDANVGTISATMRLVSLHHSANDSLPMYLQPTLGGSDIDGTNTLRGYRDYRFRAPNVLAAQLEYARSIFDPLGFVVFYDAGQAAETMSAFRAQDFHHSYGAAITFRAGDRVFLQFSLGRGSEGTRPHFGGNTNDLAGAGTARVF